MTNLDVKEEPCVARRPAAEGGEEQWSHTVMRAAWLVSLLFRQTYYPLVAVAVLLNVSFLRLLSLQLRVVVVAEVAVFTIVFPHLANSLFDYATQRTVVARRPRMRRQVHHLFTYIGFVLCIQALQRLHMPFFVMAYLWAAVTFQVVCLFVGMFWNISVQCAAAGSVVGSLMAYSLVMNRNAVWWLCLAVLMCGLVGTSRMLLRRNSLAQVVAGMWTGIVCGALVVLLL